MKFQVIYFLKTLIVFLMLSSSTAYSYVNLGISGFTSLANVDLEKVNNNSISASVGVGLLSNLIIGINHRRIYSNRDGYKRNSYTDSNTNSDYMVYIPFKDQSETISNSINLTVILYKGFTSPFIFGGVTRKDYTSTVTLGEQSSTQKFSMPIAPNFGAGVSFKISRSFSFKITETLSPGLQTYFDDEGNEQKKKVNDTYTELGISYNLM